MAYTYNFALNAEQFDFLLYTMQQQLIAGKASNVRSMPLQVFHLPETMLQHAQHSLADSSANASDDDDNGYQAAADVSEQQGFAGASATDTGRWGKRLHEPSPFLSHDLWGKLGKP